MSKLLRVALLIAFLTPALPTVASASGYMEWIDQCSTGSFVSCASVRISVQGTIVYLQVRNTSSGSTYASADGYRGSVFHSVSLHNLPANVVADAGWLNMTSPYYSGGKTPSKWEVTGTNGNGQGIQISSPSGASIQNGIASNCMTTSPNLVPSRTNLWMNPECGTTNVANPTAAGGYTQLSFEVNNTFDPTTASVVVKAIDEGNNVYDIRMGAPVMVTPEPVSMMLLGSGLLGLGGARLARRRREDGREDGAGPG